MTTPRVMARCATALVLVGALSATACSVSTNEDPVAAGNIFREFVESTTTTSTSTPENVTKAEPVYFLQTSGGRSRLVPVDREFNLDAQVQQVLDNLFTVPPDSDGDERPAEQGLSTEIPDTAVLVSATLTSPGSNELVVDVTGIFGTLQGTELRNALAQIVWTATTSPDIRQVSFRRDGEQVGVIVGNGETVERPVDRADYTSLN